MLVRHGQSTWNAVRRWQGQADPPLSELGEQQAAAATVDEQNIVRIWASPLLRARRTAEILGASLGLPVVLDARLMERHVGEWTGLTAAEIEEGWPGYLSGYQHPEGFETDDLLLARSLPVLEEIATDAAGQSVLVVTHGGWIRALERKLQGKGPPLSNLGGRVVEWTDGELVLGDRVLLLDPDAVEVTTPRQL